MALVARRTASTYDTREYRVNTGGGKLTATKTNQNYDQSAYEQIDYNQFDDASFNRDSKDIITEYKKNNHASGKDMPIHYTDDTFVESKDMIMDFKIRNAETKRAKIKIILEKTQSRIDNEVPDLVKYIEEHDFSIEDKAAVRDAVQNLQLALDAGYYSDVNDLIDILKFKVDQDRTKELLVTSNVSSYISRMQSALNHSDYDIDPQVRAQMQQLIDVYANVDSTCGYDNVKTYTDLVKEYYDSVGQQAIVYAINKKDYRPQTKENFYTYLIDKFSDGMVKAGNVIGINDYVANSKVVDFATKEIASAYNLAREVNKQNLQIFEGVYDTVLSAGRFIPGVDEEAIKKEISKNRTQSILDYFDPNGEYTAIADANAFMGFTSDGSLTKLSGGVYRVGAIVALGKVAGAKLGPVAGAKVATGIQVSTAVTQAYSQALQDGYNRNSVVLDIGNKDTKIKVDYSKYLEIRDLDEGEKTSFSSVQTTDPNGNKVTLELSIKKISDDNYEVTDQYGRKYNYSGLEEHDVLQAEFRAIAYGGFEALQWYLGRKNNDLFKTRVGGKYVDLQETVIKNVLKRTGLDILDAAVETPIRSLIDYTYDDDLTFKEAWEKQGGWSGLLVQAGIGGVFSLGLETATNDVFRSALKEGIEGFVNNNQGAFFGFGKKPIEHDYNLDVQKYREIQDAWKVTEAATTSNLNVKQRIEYLCQENSWLRSAIQADQNGFQISLKSAKQIDVYNQYKQLKDIYANNMQSLEIAGTVLTGSESILNNSLKHYITVNSIDIDALTETNKRAIYDILKNQKEIGAFVDYDTFKKNYVDIIADTFDEQALNNDMFGSYIANKKGIDTQLGIINAAEAEIERLKKLNDGWLENAIQDSQKLGRVSVFGEEQADIYSKYAAAKASQDNAYQQLVKIQSTDGFDYEMIRYLQKSGIDPAMLSDEYKRTLLQGAIDSGLVNSETTFDGFMSQYNSIKQLSTAGVVVFDHTLNLTGKMLDQLDDATKKTARIVVKDTLNSDNLDVAKKPVNNTVLSVEKMKDVLDAMNVDATSFDGLNRAQILTKLENWTSYDNLLSNKDVAVKVLNTLPATDVMNILEHTKDNSLIAQVYGDLPSTTRQYLKQNMELSLGYELATKYGLEELYNPNAAGLINFKNNIANMYEQRFPGIFDVSKIKADTDKIFFYTDERFAAIYKNPSAMAFNNVYSESFINMKYDNLAIENNINHEVVHAAARDSLTGVTGFDGYNTALNECATEYMNKLLMGKNYYTYQTGCQYCGYQPGSERFSDILKAAGISNEQFATYYAARDTVGFKNAVDSKCGAGFFDCTTQLLEVAIGPDVAASEDAIGQLYSMIRSVYAGR